MNFKKNLKSANFLLFLGICLITIGCVFYFLKTKEVVQIIPKVTSPPDLTFAKVTRVIDGDTIVIDTGEKIRYIGINTPELEISECYATEASGINQSLVLDKVVRLEKDTSETDKYGRLLRYVYVGNDFINNELVKNGSARVETVKPDIKYEGEFVTWQKFAEQNKLGLWGKCI